MLHKAGSGRKQGRRARQPQPQRAPAPAPGRPAGGDPSALLLHLQRTVGNQAVNTLLRDYAASPAPSRPSLRAAQFEIDSDGDQRNDLSLKIRASADLWEDPHLTVALGLTPPAAFDAARDKPTPVSVEVTQLSSPWGTRKLEFDWPSPFARLFPAVVAPTDGKGPTTILLTPDAGQQLLLIYPPTSSADGLQYRVEAAGKDATLTFVVPAATPPQDGAGVAAAGAPFTADTLFGTISAVDVTLGASGDQFRIAVAPIAPDRALFSITAPHERESRGTMPVPITLNGPFSLRVVDTGSVSLGLDLNGDDKPEIQIFDQLEIFDRPDSPYADTNTPGMPGEDRHHKVRATGPALGADVIFPFTVQGGAVTSAMVAIGGITALDVPLGPFGDTFRLTFQPTAPDRALFGISSSDPSSRNEGLGTEIALNGPFSVQMIDVGPASVGLDLNGDGKPEMEIVDQVDYWEKDEAVLHGGSERSHTVWVTGSAIGIHNDRSFPFTVQGGRLLPGLPGNVLKEPNELGKAATADAMVVEALADQANEGDILQQIDACERRLWAIRIKTEGAGTGADDDGISSRGMYHALLALSSDLIALEPQINQQRRFNLWSTLAQGTTGPQLQREILAHSIDPTLQGAAVAHAVALVDLIPEPDDWEETPWDAQRRLGNSMVSALKAGAWESAISSYQQMVYLLDEQMVAGLKSAKDGDSAAAQEAASLVAQEHELRDVAEHNPKRLLAVFLPDEKFRTEAGYVAKVPLSLYYWKEGPKYRFGKYTWHLKDQTNPEKTHEYDPVDGTGDQTEPPDALWDKLNSDRFPVGVIRYQIPGGASGVVQTTSPLTFKKFLGYLGMGLAALGLVLAPFDAPVVAEVFTLSAIASGVAAGMDLAEHLQEGDLDVTTALLDVAQIVSALAGTSALAAGRIRTAALNTVAEGGADAGAAARLAAFAGKVYVPMAKTAAAADAVNVATFSFQTAMQLDAIEYGPGSRADKDRAKLRLLAQLAVTGGVAAISIKGISSLPGEGSIITIATSEQGSVVVAKIAGEGSAASLTPKFDPETGLPASADQGGGRPPSGPTVEQGDMRGIRDAEGNVTVGGEATGPAPAEPAGAYDPAVRTDDELAQDMNRAPRPGETPDEALARARSAAQALYLRQTMRTYHGLGEEPPILEMRTHDAQHAADGAHTIERHGPDVPLRRTDVPRGMRTIEGRIYGDPPWGRPANWSYRWNSPSAMNDTINTYLRANWETIRSELAMEGTFEATFDAGHAIGEGFFNAGQMGVGPVDAVYHQTSTVTITLHMIPGPPPSFVVVRAFPAGRGS